MMKSIDEMKKIYLTILSFMALSGAMAQTFTLEDAWQAAKANYPAIKKYGLIKKSTEYSLQNANRAYLPQFSLGGQATYQSDVTKIPISLPNIKIQEMSKDQYKIQAEVSQLIYDGGAINAQKEILKATEAAQLQNIEITMQSVKERVSDIFFGILLLDEQLEQTRLKKESLEASLKKADAAYANGAGFKSNVNELKAEILSANMTAIEIKSAQQGYKDMLFLLTRKEITEKTTFVKPAPTAISTGIHRPELTLFDVQKNLYDAQRKKLHSEWMPKFSAFVQGGYGRPGLNMLNNDFAAFAIGGIRFSFPINSIYNWKNNTKMIELNKEQLDTDKETFLLNTHLSLQKQSRETEKYKNLLTEDDSMIELRKAVATAARSQLDNNVITVSEFIQKLNAQYLAMQMKSLHELQYIQSSYNYSNISGN
jgi:outer membrane protein TolC